MILLSNIDFTLPLADPVLKFLLILLIILAAPLLLNKLRVTHLLGLIIDGAIIGPDCFISCSWPGWKSIWGILKRTVGKVLLSGCTPS